MANVKKLKSIRNNNIIDSSAKQFAVTVTYTDLDKAFVFDYLTEYCSELLISEELHENGIDYHHHLYLKFYQKLKRIEVLVLFRDIYIREFDLIESPDTDHLYVSTVRNLKRYLSYITKEDPQPLYKGHAIWNQISFFTRATKWATDSQEYDFTHPFVLNNPNMYRVLQGVFTQTKNKQSKNQQVKKLKPIHTCCNNPAENPNWQDKVIAWWNDWAINGYAHKKKQLYLWGIPNAGKTYFINYLLKIAVDHGTDNIDDQDVIDKQVFRPTPNETRFAWQRYQRNSFNIMLIDEYYNSEYNIADIKRVLAGETLLANVKGLEPKEIRIQLPTIIISNFAPPDEQTNPQYTGIRERLKIVMANKKFY